MKLTNVHYEYRGNNTWRIYFKDYQESEAFKNERTDGKKPRYLAICSNNLGIQYYVEAKLTGQFSILRHYVKDPTNDYFSNDVWRALVKKIEGADSDYVFDEIDLRYDATIDKCYFRICCMNGGWTEFLVKNMLNSQFGMVAQANGYYDTDTVGEGGFCVRRSCCGIGFDPNTYKTSKERIMFSVKDHCSNGMADIIKVGAWTSTFIGTNKEDEKEYSWSDFKKYMGLLHANGSDIWDIEWKYDELCPMTGTEIADELHMYLKPEAYKRLFEEEKKDKMVWLSTGTLWSNNDYLARVQALTPPPVPYWAKLDDDSKIGFRQKDADEVQKEIDEMTKKIYEKLEIKQVKDFDTDTAWHEYLTATEMARLCADFDGDIIDFVAVEPIDLINRKEKEANNKEDKNMGTKLKYIENVKDIVECGVKAKDSKTHIYRVYFEKLSDMKNFSDRVMRCIMQDKGHMCYYYFTVKSCSPVIAKYKTLYFIWDNDERCYTIDWDTTENKEDNNMKIYWDESQPRIENIRDIVLSAYKYDRSVYYYRVYFESVVDAKNVMECRYNRDKGRHYWYYMTIASTAELSEEMKGSIKTLYLTYDKDKKEYYINWTAMYGTLLETNAHFEMKMTAQLNDEQLKVWEAALGIDKLPKHKKEKTVGDIVNELTEEQKKVLYYLIAEAQKSGKAESPEPTKILIQGTATIIWWSDGTKTVVKCQKGDKMDPEKGIAMCVMKKFMGTNDTHSNYLDFAKDAIAKYEKQQAAEKAKKKAEADKKRRAAAKKKGTAGNANYKRGTKAKTEAKAEKEPESKEES